MIMVIIIIIVIADILVHFTGEVCQTNWTNRTVVLCMCHFIFA